MKEIEQDKSYRFQGIDLQMSRLLRVIRRNKIKITSIVEAGARDCTTTLLLREIFPQAEITAFECNPNNLEDCRKALEGTDIRFVPKGLSDQRGFSNFYLIDEPGSSSLYPHVGFNSEPIKVELTRLLDEFNAMPSLLWLDAQGAELQILKGAGVRLKNVQIIQTEVFFQKGYKGQPSYWDIKKYLYSKGFYLETFSSDIWTYSDAVFVKGVTLVPAWWVEFRCAVLRNILKRINDPAKLLVDIKRIKFIPRIIKVLVSKNAYETK